MVQAILEKRGGFEGGPQLRPDTTYHPYDGGFFSAWQVRYHILRARSPATPKTQTMAGQGGIQCQT
jgi:hypothetical protein